MPGQWPESRARDLRCADAASTQRQPKSLGQALWEGCLSRISHALQDRPVNREVPHAPLDADAVRAAYRRWAGVYDAVFGGVSAFGRRRAVALVNSLPGAQVLEVGVGTGLALPHYRRQKRITGIDLSAEMLARARERAAALRLLNVAALREMDAEAMDFHDGAFDVAVAMFVASVVPNPRRLLEEMRRVVRPGGRLPVRQSLRRRARRKVVDRARHGSGLARARLASGLLDGRLARAARTARW